MPNLNIRRLKLINYRCFPEIEIEFHDQLTVLVASNGGGKTSLLDAIAVAFGPYVGAFDEGMGRGFSPNDIRLVRVRDTVSNEMEYALGGVSLCAQGYIPGSAGRLTVDDSLNWQNWSRSLAGPKKSKTTLKDAKTLTEYGKRMQDEVRSPGSASVLPVLAYYGTGRLWQQKKLMTGKLPRTSRTIGYTDCLDPASSYKSFADWFRYWSLNALKGRMDAAESGLRYMPSEFDNFVEAVAGAINICLAPSGWKNIEYLFSREELVAHHDEFGELPVALLSDGIRNMIGMAADIAFRAAKLNPNLGPYAASDTPGIVLIDEVDMHLHPEWQQLVLTSLTKAFPRIQFIVSTHSPQVLTTVGRENIRIISKTESGWTAQMPAMSPLARESGDALAEIMEVNTRPPLAILESIHAYEQLIRSGLEDTSQAHDIKAVLDLAGYQIPDADFALWMFLGQQAKKAGR